MGKTIKKAYNRCVWGADWCNYNISLCPSDTSRWTTKSHVFFLLSFSLQLNVRLSDRTFRGKVTIADGVSIICKDMLKLIHISCWKVKKSAVFFKHNFNTFSMVCDRWRRLDARQRFKQCPIEARPNGQPIEAQANPGEARSRSDGDPTEIRQRPTETRPPRPRWHPSETWAHLIPWV